MSVAVLIQNFPPLGVAATVATYCIVKRQNPLSLSESAKTLALTSSLFGLMLGGIVGHAVADDRTVERPIYQAMGHASDGSVLLAPVLR